MITLPKLAAEALGTFLAADMKDGFGRSHARLAEIIPFVAQVTLECIGNSDALYHNVEHTMLVTLAGHDIFKGWALLTAATPIEYSNFIVACLTHDIGYVRGVLKGDGTDGLVVDAAGRKVTLPRGSSDAALAPYHVERSKLFVLDRLAEIEELDGARIAGAIEHTRVPFLSAPEDHAIDEWAALLRATVLRPARESCRWQTGANPRAFLAVGPTEEYKSVSAGDCSSGPASHSVRSADR